MDVRFSANRRARSRSVWRPKWILTVTCVAVALSGCSTSQGFDIFKGVQPRLANNEAERVGPVINDAAFNGPAEARTIAPYAGYVGSLRVSYEGDRKAIEQDLRELGQVAPPSFDPNEMVTVDFTDASLAFILEQLLRGALGVNYVAPQDLPTGITFRTETPIPKSRVLQVVRDLLARNNLVMRFINGVYQIGEPEVIERLEANAALGGPSEDVVRVVRLDRGNAAQVAELATQLLPQNVSVLVTSSPNAVVVRANPNDIESIERMLQTLSERAVDYDRVAIIPLSKSAPEAVAAKLMEFYAPSLRDDTERVTIVPLQNQQAILVGTSDPSLMGGLTQLVQQLDRSATDVSELRIIPLTHIKAADIVPQLTQIFGSTTSQLPEEPDTGAEGPSTGVRSRLRSPTNDYAEETSVLAPSLPQENSISEGQQGQSGGNRVEDAFSAGATTPLEGETRIVADTRTNSILVYSTYSIYKRMREVVETLDVPQAQVVIEATVVEVQLNDALDSGVQFFLQYKGIVAGSGVPNGNQSPSRGGMIGIGANFGSVSVDAILRALREVTTVRVVSSPYLTVVDGQSARLVIGDQIPFAATSQTSNNQGAVTVTQQVEILDTGIVLEITPRIHANNSVTLNVVQSVSSPVGEVKEGNLTPTISTRDISSQILAQSGRTILLGGLIQESNELREEGVPGASNLPVVGPLFRQNKSDAQRTELLVLITPRVVRSSPEIEAITRRLQGSHLYQSYPDLKSHQ